MVTVKICGITLFGIIVMRRCALVKWSVKADSVANSIHRDELRMKFLLRVSGRAEQVVLFIVLLVTLKLGSKRFAH
jgi:hypothetical protein